MCPHIHCMCDLSRQSTDAVLCCLRLSSLLQGCLEGNLSRLALLSENSFDKKPSPLVESKEPPACCLMRPASSLCCYWSRKHTLAG